MSQASTSTPQSEVARATSRQHFPEKTQQQWNFLRGEGPSSSEMYYAPEKKSWKPGWNTMRQQAAIQPEKERLEYQAVKAQRQTAIHQLQADRLNRCQDPNMLNPITGQPRAVAGSLASSAAPGPRQGLRPAATIHAMESISRPDPKDRSQRVTAAYESRKERLANDGLASAQHKGGTAASCLNWQS